MIEERVPTAEGTVWTMLFSRTVLPPSTCSSPTEITAAGHEAPNEAGDRGAEHEAAKGEFARNRGVMPRGAAHARDGVPGCRRRSRRYATVPPPVPWTAHEPVSGVRTDTSSC